MTRKQIGSLVFLVLAGIVTAHNYQFKAESGGESNVGSTGRGLKLTSQAPVTDLSSWSNSQCQNDTDEFLQKCKIQLTGFQVLSDESYAACCWDPQCCTQTEQLLNQQCFQNRCEDFDFETLQLISTYHTLCQDGISLPECRDDSVLMIPSECQDLNEQMQRECGYQNNSFMDVFLRESDEHLLACCWPNSCCDITKEYYSKGCDLNCWSGDPSDTDFVGWGYGDYAFGNGIANVWQQVCEIPSDLESNCPNTPVITNEATVDQKSAVDNQYGSEGVGSVQVECSKTRDDFLNESFGPKGPWTTTTKTFCNYTLQDIQDDASKEIELCCDVSQQMFEGACEYQSCHSTPISLFDSKTFDILSLWQIICKPSIPTCDLNSALQLASGGNTAQFQILSQQNSNSPPIPLLGSTAPPSPDILTSDISLFEALAQIPVLSFYNQGALSLKLEQTLQAYNHKITMFVPTNMGVAAVMEYFNTTAERMAASVGNSLWSASFLQHVSLVEFKVTDLEAGRVRELSTLASSSLWIEVGQDGQVGVCGCCSKENCAKVVTNAKFRDGSLWVLDGMILPTELAERVFESRAVP